MAFELVVLGGQPVGLRRLLLQARHLGVELEPHPETLKMFSCYSGWFPVRIAVTRDDLFDGADRFVAAGRLHAGFELELEAFGPGMDAEAFEATLDKFDTWIARLVREDAPTTVIDSIRERRASCARSTTEHHDEQRVYLRTTAGRTGADFIAQTVCAAAWALCAGGSLVDLHGEVSPPGGEDILAALYHHLDGFFADPVVEIGTPFTAW